MMKKVTKYNSTTKRLNIDAEIEKSDSLCIVKKDFRSLGVLDQDSDQESSEEDD